MKIAIGILIIALLATYYFLETLKEYFINNPELEPVNRVACPQCNGYYLLGLDEDADMNIECTCGCVFKAALSGTQTTINSNTDMKKLKAYIAGKMTGLPDLNHSAFLKASITVAARGYDVIIPHDIAEANPGLSWEEYMKLDIITLVRSNVLFILNDAPSSPGATIEVELALKLMIPVLWVDTNREVTSAEWREIKAIVEHNRLTA
jgi:hypothetical protein